MRYLKPAAGVFPALGDGAVALMDVRRGGRPWFTTGTGARMLTELAGASGDADGAVERLLLCWPGVASERIREDFATFVGGLRSEGLLVPASRAGLWPTSPQGEIPSSLTRLSAPLRWRLVAAVCAVLVLRVGGLRGALAVVARLHRLKLAEANLYDTAAAVAAVSACWRWWPGRAACAERSLAAVLLLAATGRRAEFTIGVGFAPNTCHAWVSVDGVPVGETAPDGWRWTAAVSV